MIPFLLRNIHWLLSLLAAVALVPTVNGVHLPLRWDITSQIETFVIIGFKSASLAVVLYAIQFPGKVIRIIYKYYWRDKLGLLLTLLFVAALIPIVGITMTSASIINALALFQLWRNTSDRKVFKEFSGLLAAATYLFVGLIIVFTYNSIVVRMRYFGAYDEYLFGLDRLIFGISVPEISNYATRVLSERVFITLNAVYFGMFFQIGAALYICGILSGWQRAVRFVGTILLTYYIALVLFYLLPAKGPYYFSEGLLSQQLVSLRSCAAQKSLVAVADHLWRRKPLQIIPLGYYISFPCMHIVQPLVVLWFLRGWRRVAAVLFIYDVLLVVAIILLNWHYIVDIVGGIVVAATILLVTTDSEQSSFLPNTILKQPL